ncbi:uncharacterized protein TNIN_313371 [Trichonephila inaurata madagascariensis]|uniref:Uncharacterized protein n=1 Tax=Trichonephila inaurata madagascariensis TaxID=2747483 RepID=A0A8X7C574_9ARAC|nr:uncharacterized protein TNIN_313371 [Trichonephila inaurata madagascariensis]
MHFVEYFVLAVTFTSLMTDGHLHPNTYDTRRPDDYLLLQRGSLPRMVSYPSTSETAVDDLFRAFFDDDEGNSPLYFFLLPKDKSPGTQTEPHWRKSKRVLGAFTKTKPSLYVKSNTDTGGSQFLNTYVRGHFGLSRYTFDRPRPLRWG